MFCNMGEVVEYYLGSGSPSKPVLGGTSNPTTGTVYKTGVPYEWSGKSRPNINDYIAPWIEKASQTTYKYTGTKKKKEHNSAVQYAQNQMQAAIAKYESDLAFWNEMDERLYTTPSAQSQRYEDAGFNMGYMYSNVDSGNSAVGYGQQESSFSPAETEGDNLGGAKLVADVVGTIAGIFTGLVNSGVSVARAVSDIAVNSSRIALQGAQTALTQAQAAWEKCLQSYDSAGNKVDDIAKSIAFQAQQAGLSKTVNEGNYVGKQIEDITKFLVQADNIYKKQAYNPDDGLNDINQSINTSDMSDGLKILCKILARWAWSAGQNVSFSFGRKK